MCRCRGKPIDHRQVPKFLCVPGDSPPPEAPRWHPGTRELPRLVRQQETFLGPQAAWSDGRTSVLWGWVSLGKGMRGAAWIFRELVFSGGCVSHVPDTPAGTSTAQPGLIGPEAKSQIPAGSVGPCAAGGGAGFGNHQTGESRTLPCSARGIGHSWASPEILCGSRDASYRNIRLGELGLLRRGGGCVETSQPLPVPEGLTVNPEGLVTSNWRSRTRGMASN